MQILLPPHVKKNPSKIGQVEKELLKRKIERTQKALEKLNAKLSDAA